MAAYREIRARYDEQHITVYQAYGPDIAEPALAAGHFVAPFSFQRMTWIKPSFLWLMERSGWACKPRQERILAVTITRAGWERALGEAVLTSFQPGVHASATAWTAEFKAAPVHVQWDPERSLRGAKLEHRSIQVGISRDLIRDFDSWIVGLADLTPTVKKMRAHLDRGDSKRARRLLPAERVYPTPPDICARLGMEST